MGAASLVIRGIVFLIGIPFLLFGLFFLLLGGWGVYDDYQATQGVVSTEGTITSTSLEEATKTEDGTRETVYYPRARYTYSVDGQTYEGRWIFAPNDRSLSGELEGREYEDITEAQKVVSQYREGQSATVYYYKGEPSEPFLERPTVGWGGAIVALIFGGIPLAIGLFLSGGALLFGRIRERFGGKSRRKDRSHDDFDHDGEAGWDVEEEDEAGGGDDGDDGDGGDSGGWGGFGGFDGGGGDGGGGGGGE